MKYICDNCDKPCPMVYASLDKKRWLCSNCNRDDMAQLESTDNMLPNAQN